ncbi:MAG: mucoidy inhibitor MuiA family protein [Bacteroidota bacterium]
MSRFSMLSSLLTLLFISLFCTSGRAQKETPLTSKISSAIVFLDGAQVNRTVQAKVPAGRATLVFTGLTTDLNPNSIQVSAPDDDLIVLSVSHRLNFNEVPKEDPATEAVYDQMDALDARKARLNTQIKIGQEEEAILQQNRQVASQQTGLDAEDLIKAINFHRERITTIRMDRLDLVDSLSLLEEERETLQKQLAEIGKKREVKATAEVVVITEAKRATTSPFTLSYLVPNAKWTPSYDVRVADISKPIDLRYRAKVSQNSGEDWDNIRLKLSTGDPSASGVAPTLPVWRLYSGSRPPTYRPTVQAQAQFGYRIIEGTITDDTGEPLIGCSILVPGTTIGTVTGFDGSYRLEVPAGTNRIVVSYTGYATKTMNVQSGWNNVVLDTDGVELEEVVVTAYGVSAKKDRSRREKVRVRGQAALADAAPATSAPVPVQVERRATTVNFDIELPYTIPADGKSRDVEINQHELPAEYTHLAIPKFSPDAYLTASVTDWEQYDLLSGDVQLFFEGTYLGNSRLDVESTKDTLELSLGKDPGIVIERKAVDEYREKNFFGSKVTDSRGYHIEVRNKKNQAVNLTILDQIPVSANEKIEVKSDIGKMWKLAEKTGMLTWEVQLAPQAEAKGGFKYSVKYEREASILLE